MKKKNKNKQNYDSNKIFNNNTAANATLFFVHKKMIRANQNYIRQTEAGDK